MHRGRREQQRDQPHHTEHQQTSPTGIEPGPAQPFGNQPLVPPRIPIRRLPQPVRSARALDLRAPATYGEVPFRPLGRTRPVVHIAPPARPLHVANPITRVVANHTPLVPPLPLTSPIARTISGRALRIELLPPRTPGIPIVPARTSPTGIHPPGTPATRIIPSRTLPIGIHPPGAPAIWIVTGRSTRVHPAGIPATRIVAGAILPVGMVGLEFVDVPAAAGDGSRAAWLRCDGPEPLPHPPPLLVSRHAVTVGAEFSETSPPTRAFDRPGDNRAAVENPARGIPGLSHPPAIRAHAASTGPGRPGNFHGRSAQQGPRLAKQVSVGWTVGVVDRPGGQQEDVGAFVHELRVLRIQQAVEGCQVFGVE